MERQARNGSLISKGINQHFDLEHFRYQNWEVNLCRSGHLVSDLFVCSECGKDISQISYLFLVSKYDLENTKREGNYCVLPPSFVILTLRKVAKIVFHLFLKQFPLVLIMALKAVVWLLEPKVDIVQLCSNKSKDLFLFYQVCFSTSIFLLLF